MSARLAEAAGAPGRGGGPPGHKTPGTAAAMRTEGGYAMTIQDQADGSQRPHRPQAAVGGAGLAGPADSQDMTGVWFPRLAARDLDGCEVALPAGLPGEWNVVIVAFRREQQDLVDSWVPWLEQRAAADPRLGFVELPAIGCAGSQPARSSTAAWRRPSP